MNVTLTKNREDWILSYLTIWQSFLNLTERELELTALIAARYLELTASVQDQRLLAELLLSPSAKLSFRRALSKADEESMSANNLQNYFSSLKDKGVLVPLDDKYTLYDKLIPRETITFTFTIQE